MNASDIGPVSEEGVQSLGKGAKFPKGKKSKDKTSITVEPAPAQDKDDLNFLRKSGKTKQGRDRWGGWGKQAGDAGVT